MTQAKLSRSTTDHQHARRPAPRLPLLALLCAIVLLFRAAAFLEPSGAVVIPASLALPLNALGALFLACAAWAWGVRPSPLTRPFLIYGLGMGVHWGGTVASDSPRIETALLVLYAAATVAADGAFFDLSLRYPRQQERPALVTLAFLGPAILTLLALPVAPHLPRATLELALGLVFSAAFLISIAGGVVFLAKWLRASSLERRALRLTPIVVVLVVASVVNLLGEAGALPGPPQVWSLAYGLIPLTLAWALTRGGAAPVTSTWR
jgi:hypothetical protein